MQQGKQQHVRGVTLVELMVALVVSSVLLLGVIKIYTSSKGSSKVNNDFAIMQEDGRIAMKYLVEDIRMAGYLGCAFNDGDSTKFQCLLGNGGTGSYICTDFTAGVVGYDYVGTEANTAYAATPSTYTLTEDASNYLNQGNEATGWKNATTTGLPATFPSGTRTPINGSDIIIVKHGDIKSVSINADKSSGTYATIDDQGAGVTTVGTKSCHTPSGFCIDDILLESDCGKARVFEATQLTQNSGSIEVYNDNSGTTNLTNTTTSWGFNTTDATQQFFKTDTEISRFHTWAYFVARNPNNEPALYRHDGIGNDPPEELVEGIESMQILYGVDKDGDGTANYYASADQVNFTDTTQPVVSIRISLLVRSKAQLNTRAAGTKTYILATSNIANAQDRRLRKVFTTTIKIRNKGEGL